jgi:hypothetical protein
MIRDPFDGVRFVTDALCVLGGIFYGALVLAALLAVYLVYPSHRAHSQQNHHHHHVDYQNWVNQVGEGCCNNQDCGTLNEADERTQSGVLEVRIEGAWCPVLSKHYLRRGNAPDATTAHVCVWHQASRPGQGPCERMLCYQPRPLT